MRRSASPRLRRARLDDWFGHYLPPGAAARRPSRGGMQPSTPSRRASPTRTILPIGVETAVRGPTQGCAARPPFRPLLREHSHQGRVPSRTTWRSQMRADRSAKAGRDSGSDFSGTSRGPGRALLRPLPTPDPGVIRGRGSRSTSRGTATRSDKRAMDSPGASADLWRSCGALIASPNWRETETATSRRRRLTQAT